VNDTEKVTLLLLTRNDYLPGLRTATGTLTPAPGPQASKYVPCQECGATGRIRGIHPCVICRDRKRQLGRKPNSPRHGCDPCPVCNGNGERRRRAGDPAHDAYTGKPLDELQAEIANAWLENRKPRRLILQDDRPDQGGYRWEREQARYMAAGSYRELSNALEWLRDTRPLSFSQIASYALLGGHDPDTLQTPCRTVTYTDHHLTTIRIITIILAHRMPKPIRVPPWVVTKQQAA
jgi:hypothetical protein